MPRIVIAWGDPYVIDAAGFWLSRWQRRRLGSWRGRSAWGVTHPGEVSGSLEEGGEFILHDAYGNEIRSARA